MGLLIKVFTVLLISGFAVGLDEDSAKELRCAKVPVTNHDIGWAMNVPKFYFPRFSRLDLYRGAAMLTGKPVQDIREDELYYNACFKMNWGADGTKISGFGQSKQYPLSPVGKNVFEYSYGNEEAKNGTVYVTLTDSQTFLVFAVCWVDDEMSWTVASTTRTLRPETSRQIEEHLVSLGFGEEYFTSLKYHSCWKNAQYEEYYPI